MGYISVAIRYEKALPITTAVTTNVCFEGICKVLCLSVRALKSNMQHRYIYILIAFYSQGLSLFSYNRTSSPLHNFQGISWIEKSMHVLVQKILFIVQKILLDTIHTS